MGIYSPCDISLVRIFNFGVDDSKLSIVYIKKMKMTKKKCSCEMWGRTITLLFGRKLRTSINSHFFFLSLDQRRSSTNLTDGGKPHPLNPRPI